MAKKKAPEWFKIFETALVVLVVPALIFYSIARVWPLFLDVSYHVIVIIMVFQAGLSYWYTASVFSRKKFVPRPAARNRPVPRTTFIVSAYLPNEVSVVEETILNILTNVTRPAEGIEVILAYNTPHLEPLELKLRELAYQWPELILANAYGSRTKSENLNYASGLATGEMSVLLDSDHRVAGDCLGRAWRWLDGGYDVVQGRCKVRNGEESLIARIVEVEFEVIYGLQHPSKSIIFDTSLFGGSNGYWKTSALRQVRFDENMLTEDIDSTIRGILAGCRFVMDRSIISTELAPNTLKGLWYQRKRWSQGWFQCSIKYQIPMWTTPHLNPAQKFLWTTLLSWRLGYDFLSTMLLPVLFAFWLFLGRVTLPVNAFIVFALVFTLFNGPWQAFAAYKNAAVPRAQPGRYLLYALAVWPYTMFKMFLHLVAVRDEMIGENAWVISERSKR